MITLISGTNRKNNVSLQVTKEYSNMLSDQGINNQILDLSDLPKDFLFTALYGESNKTFDEIVSKYIVGATSLVIVSPEYNGSYPGILKSFIDGWNPKILKSINVALVGVASGRQGNSRGMDQITNVLNYLNFKVIPFKIPISKVYEVVDKSGKIIDAGTKAAIEKQINQLQ